MVCGVRACVRAFVYACVVCGVRVSVCVYMCVCIVCCIQIIVENSYFHKTYVLIRGVLCSVVH